ncbi:hypothetical protein KUTeg_014399 [Tegillarca granosa]|uniref:tRNA (guanine(37)-N1)-methyltransferase n=1 Tax=Tegillarca granosa TaxID=220873 RepID=A0ABQ9F1Q3_TEGGR|nr:hypothetical protein KUTeg_014399 [Tegillarca granosa]
MQSLEEKTSIEDNIVAFDRSPPSSVRGMKVLDRNAFKKVIQVPSIAVPCKDLKSLLRKVKPYLFKFRFINAVADLAKNDPAFKSYKLLLLDPDSCGSVEKIPESLKTILKDRKVDFENGFRMTKLELDYNNWNATETIHAILPEDVDNISGFSVVGHIAHLNLNEEALPYKHIIGQVFLDKTPTIKTVVNKLNTIDNTFRNFQMEVLAGEENFVTRVRENGFVFEMDFSKVYWNSRLGTEHQRIVSELNEGDVLYDIFAGVGPFAIPAAKKAVFVYANDLNPASFEALEKNTKIRENKVNSEFIKCYNLDGREFIKTVIKKDLSERLCNRTVDGEETRKTKIHIVMNLPAIAVEFLDTFRGLLANFKKDIADSLYLPYVYCYFFSKNVDYPEDELRERLKSSIGDLPPGYSVRFVRNVAPKKDMFCFNFQLSRSYLCDEEDEIKEDVKKCQEKSSGTLDIAEEKTDIEDEVERKQKYNLEGCEPDQKKLKLDTS